MLPLTSNNWTTEETDAIQQVVESGYYTMGEKVDAFEQAFAKYHSVNHAVMVNSGSSANLAAVAALIYSDEYNLKPGDEVIVPSVGWATSYYPLHQYGLTMRFVDIDLQTLNYDLNSLESAITPKTRMILAINILGNPNKLREIRALCDEKSLILFEDNCESFGAKYENRLAGTWGHIGTFSTYFSHHLNTIEGGIVLSESNELDAIIRSIRSHGWDRNIDLSVAKREKSTREESSFNNSFDFYYPAYNLRPMELSAAIGLVQLKKVESLIKARRNNAKQFKEIMETIPWLQPQQESGESSWFSFAMIINNSTQITRAELVKTLEAGGITTRPIVSGNFLKQPVMKYMNHTVYNTTPNADIVHNSGFYIGNHVHDISSALRDFQEICTTC